MILILFSGKHLFVIIFFQEALACYELLAKEHSNDDLGLRVQMGMIRCSLSLDQPYAALYIAEGAIFKK